MASCRRLCCILPTSQSRNEGRRQRGVCRRLRGPRRNGDVLREARSRRHGRTDRRPRQRGRRAANERRAHTAPRLARMSARVELYRAASGELETVRGTDIRFDYRHTSFAPDDVMLRVKLELPPKPFKEILAGIKVCNEKRRASQPLNQKSAGCIFKNPPGGSAGRMIDELGLERPPRGRRNGERPAREFFRQCGKLRAARIC